LPYLKKIKLCPYYKLVIYNFHNTLILAGIRNIEQVCDVLNYGVATFFAWTYLFWLEQTYKNSADVI
jgi:hypothetical protein